MADLTNDFAFSWTRHEIFYQCPRKLYWQYYGSWNGWNADASRETALAYRLKQLQNLTMLVGETFHHELAEILRRRGEGPSGVPVAQLKDDMERRLLKRLRESRNADWAQHGDPKNYAILFEDYYQSGIDDQKQAGAVAALHRCVDGLAASGFGRRVFAVPKSRLRYVDPRFDARGFNHQRVELDGLVLFASPDLVVEDEAGGFHIIDWKTGKTVKANLAQLAIYGLFVKEKFGRPLERMTAHLIYVAGGSHETITALVEGVEEAKHSIQTYCMDVRERLTDVANNVAGDIERFPMTENRMLCRSCNFRELCNRMDDAPSASDEEDPLSA